MHKNDLTNLHAFAIVAAEKSLTPALDDIQFVFNSVADLKSKPSGSIRSLASLHACETILWPALKNWLSRYPEIALEISAESRLTDMVGEGW